MSNNVPLSPTSAQSSKNADLLTVSVQDFGPIAQATVNLRPLTIFVGRSNTGKTYLSKLIYAIHKTFSGFPKIPFVERHHDAFSFMDLTDSLIAEFKDQQQVGNRKQEVINTLFDSFAGNLSYNKDQRLIALSPQSQHVESRRSWDFGS